MTATKVLETFELTKTYPGVRALDSVDFALDQGEVQALVGQNGAGKSTFIELIAGSLRPDSGRIVVEGKTYPWLDPAKSIELGIQTVHQENQLVDELTVAENIFLYNLPATRLGFVDIRASRKTAEELLDRLGIKINPDKKISKLSFIDKKLVSIAKACSRKAKILILDEPTASLDQKGRHILFDIIRHNAEKGLSVIYISHNLSEIFEVCNSVTVFKDGKKVAAHAACEIDLPTLVRQMIGRASSSLYNRPRDGKLKETVLEVRDYLRMGVVDHVSFDVRRGEIFGLGGLVGAGRTELARMIFGLDPKDSGSLVCKGQDLTPRSPDDAIRKGIGYLTEDRKGDGLVLGRPIFENISMARLAKASSPFLRLAREQTDTGGISRKLEVKTPSLSQYVINLSGGNQQKVVLAKWLFAGSEVLIFDEPTVGVDVGAKAEIYRMMDSLAQEGKAVIMISSDNPELVAVCDRVGIMRDGKIVHILEGDQITEEAILSYSMGIREGQLT